MSVIYHNEFTQNSEEWLNFRKDKITGTSAYKLLQGESVEDILAEKENEPLFTGNKFTERGHILEDEARRLFADLHPDKQVYEVGAITNTLYPNCMVSPDSLVDEDSGLEIKSFTEANHLALHEAITPEIYAQIQWAMFISERKSWTLFQYNPEVEDLSEVYFQQTFYPDGEVFEKFRQALTEKTDDSLIIETAQKIANLESILQNTPEEIKAEILLYQTRQKEIQQLKDWLKTQTKGKVKKIYTDDAGNKLDISIYDTNRISVSDEAQVPEEYTTTVQVENVFQEKNGKFYQRIPNTKLVGNMYKAGKPLPPGFKLSTSRSISIKFNGETL